jgi:hypothetical protein
MFPRHAVLPAVFVLAVCCASCTDATTSVTAPTLERCPVHLTNSLQSAPAGGATGTLALAMPRDCTWTASTAAPWIVITSSTSGQGDAAIAYRVTENGDPVERRGTIQINDAAAPIVQAAADCRFRVGPQTPDVDADGGDVRIMVESHSACEWTAASHTNWIAVGSSGGGQGNGSVSLSITANSGGARTGTATVAGALVTVRQEGASASPPGLPSPPPSPAPSPTPSPTPPAPPSPPAPCTYAINPSSAAVSASGATLDARVNTGPSCAWTARANAGWLRITSGSSAIGSGQATFSVEKNRKRRKRTGTITIAGLTFTVTQEGEGEDGDDDDDDDD